VIPTVNYEATGSMTINIPESINEEQLVDAISDSIADSLGIHPQDVEVSIDMETGEVEFIVTAEDYSDAASVQFDLENTLTQEAILNAIESSIPDVHVESYEVAEELTASLEFTVDADNATNDLTQAAWQSEQLFNAFDQVEVDNAYVTISPSLLPSL
jgi:hypothetical protein